MTSTIEDPSTKRARDHIATLALSLYQIRGLPAPGRDELGDIVFRAEASINPDQLRHPESINATAIGQIDRFVLRAADPGQRAASLHSIEATPGERNAAVAAKAGIDAERREQRRVDHQRQQDAEAERAGTADHAGSGARFDNMASLDWSSPAGLARMRGFAIQSGVPWAANNPELLRLGPAAIGALAEVHFKQETYKRLTTDASFKAKDVVVLARFAKEQHVDANKLGGDLAAAEKPLSQQERERLNGAVVPYMADAKNPAKRDDAIKAFESAKQAHPEARPALEKAQEDLHLKRVQLNHENKAANEKDSRAAEKDGRAGAEASRTAEKGSRAAQATAQTGTELAKFDALDAGPKTQAAAPAKDEKLKLASAEPSAPPAKSPPQKAPAPHKLG